MKVFNKDSNKKRIVPAAVFLGGMLIYFFSVLPFLISYKGVFFYYGDYNVQQVPFLIFAHRAVRQGRLFWNPLVDLGGNMGGTFAFYLWGSPFFWLTIPFPEAWLPYMMPFLMALKCGTASLTAYIWIRTQTRTDGAAVLGAFLYAFSGFQACNIVFQHFHDVTAFFPLYLFCFDRFVEGRKKGKGLYGFTLMTALMSVINYYFFFGQVIFLILYYLVRWGIRRVRAEGLLSVLFEGMQIIAAAAVGLLLSAFFLVQSISGILGNSRVGEVLNGYDLVVYPDSTTPLAILKSFFMVPDLIARGTLFSSDYIRNGSLAFYLPCFAMAGVFAFWMLRKQSWKKNLLSILALMAFVPVLCAVFSALNENFYTRWFYMPILICACMTAEAIEEKESGAFTKGAVLSLGCQALFILMCFLPVYDDGKWSFTNICENRKLLTTEIKWTLVGMAVLVLIVLIKRRFKDLFPSPVRAGAERADAAGTDAARAEAERAEAERAEAERADAERADAVSTDAERADAAEAAAEEPVEHINENKSIAVEINPLPGFTCVFLTVVCCVLTTMAVLHNGSSLISRSGFEKWKLQMLSQRPVLEKTDSGIDDYYGEEDDEPDSFRADYPGDPVAADAFGADSLNIQSPDMDSYDIGLPDGDIFDDDTPGDKYSDADKSSENKKSGKEKDTDKKAKKGFVFTGKTGAILTDSNPMDASVPVPFSRVETDSTSTNYEMVWGIPTMHCFESTVHPSIFKWYRGIGMIRTVESTLPFERIGARAIMSVRYYLENDLVNSSKGYSDEGGIKGYHLLNKENGYNVFETENYIPMGICFDSYITEDNYDALENGEISDRMLVKDIILSDEMAEKYGGLMTEDTELVTDVMPYSEFRDHCRQRADSACKEFAFDKNGFHALAEMEKDNLILFSVPYDKGFKVTVDGQPAEAECANFGLTTVFVPEGTHEIKFTYMPVGFVPALCVSALTALLLIADMLRRKIRGAAK